jgi:hypothetical protein
MRLNKAFHIERHLGVSPSPHLGYPAPASGRLVLQRRDLLEESRQAVGTIEDQTIEFRLATGKAKLVAPTAPYLVLFEFVRTERGCCMLRQAAFTMPHAPRGKRQRIGARIVGHLAESAGGAHPKRARFSS